MKFNLIFLFLCISIISCINKKHKEENFSFVHLKIPVGETEQIKMSDLISDFKAVMLEFTENSMIGSIQKIIVHNGLIYVLDTFGAKSLMVFDLNGKYIRKIGSSGNGPGQYLMPKDFIINTSNDEIEIIDNQKINVFSLNGEFQRNYKIGFTSVNFALLGDNYFFAVGGNEDYLIYKTNNDFKIEEKYIHITEPVIGNAFRPFIRKDELHSLYRALANDTIYLLSRNKVVPYRIVEFGKYKFNNQEYLSMSFFEKAQILTYQNNVNQCLINRYFENDNHIHIVYNMNIITTIIFTIKRRIRKFILIMSTLLMI